MTSCVATTILHLKLPRLKQKFLEWLQLVAFQIKVCFYFLLVPSTFQSVIANKENKTRKVIDKFKFKPSKKVGDVA